MKTLHISIMILSSILLGVMLSQNVAATVPLVEIMLSGTANNQNCEIKCVISQTVTVQKGSTIEWINNDLIPHTLVSGNPEDKNNGTLFDSKQIWVGKFFMYDFNDVGVYHYFERDHPENAGIINVTDGTYPHSISESTTSPNTVSSIESPLKQFNSGIAANNIVCTNNLTLVIKAEDSLPACVTPDTASILIERGWAINMSQTNHMANAKTSDPFGITALVIYKPALACLDPLSNTTASSCPPNNFYLKINSNSTAYLLGYNICDDNSCVENNTLSISLPLNTVANPDYQSIGLPVDLQWKYGDTVNIQLRVSSDTDNKHTSLIDLGNSTIVP